MLHLRGRSWSQPLWLGAEPIAGKTLLLHNDQGLGDAIQFCRYIPLLAERGARVILEIDRPLKELLSGVVGIMQCVVKGETLPDHDFHCPLASLPLAFDTMPDTIPSSVPYLSIGQRGGGTGRRALVQRASRGLESSGPATPNIRTITTGPCP
ncbi:hypothetical protein [Afipia sp. GAS231]|uniref:hypothetical protein n=1 Tax=Afipia sp. GAS231 TaxID=1882747 RepID=UPI00087A41A3|nr:hypothetical protein [Afipia sp. GAS231]SDP46539.1 hypothetical protein SAMN05444050_6950 [Afipia sp. GAS231]